MRIVTINILIFLCLKQNQLKKKKEKKEIILFILKNYTICIKENYFKKKKISTESVSNYNLGKFIYIYFLFCVMPIIYYKYVYLIDFYLFSIIKKI